MTAPFRFGNALTFAACRGVSAFRRTGVAAGGRRRPSPMPAALVGFGPRNAVSTWTRPALGARDARGRDVMQARDRRASARLTLGIGFAGHGCDCAHGARASATAGFARGAVSEIHAAHRTHRHRRLLRHARARQGARSPGTQRRAPRHGEPDFDTPKHIRDATTAAMAAGWTHRTGRRPARLPQGNRRQLERAAAFRAKRRTSIVTPGAKQVLLFAMLALLRPGDGDHPEPGVPELRVHRELPRSASSPARRCCRKQFDLDIDALRASPTARACSS